MSSQKHAAEPIRAGRVVATLALLATSALVAGCPAQTPVCGEDPPSEPGEYRCRLADFDDREYNLIVPEGDGPFPLVLNLHGGGGSNNSVDKVTCTFGDEDAYTCLRMVAQMEGFVVVEPSGSGRLNLRTWNAGGGDDGWICISGRACADDIDELAYFDALLDDLERAADIDAARIYAMGISNGGGMAHRLACERSERIAAIASFGGGNQWATTKTCSPTAPVGIITFHGSADTSWPFEGGNKADPSGAEGRWVSARETVSGNDEGYVGWAERNGCDPDAEVFDLEDRDESDGMTSTREVFSCPEGAGVELVVTEGGGHVYPGGWQYAHADRIGPVTGDFGGTEVAYAFLRQFSR